MTRAIVTNGIGSKTTSHLNLTRSLADVWGIPPDPTVRVATPDGRWLARDAMRLTLVKADAWEGPRSTAERLTVKLGNGLRVV